MPVHTIVKPEKLAAAAVGFLEQNLTLFNTFQKEDAAKFKGAEGDSLAFKVDGVLPYRVYGWRNDRSQPIQYDTLAQRKITVTFGGNIYSAVKVTDEQFNFDLAGWGDLLRPQTRAVGRGLQSEAAGHLEGAPYQVVIADAAENLRGAIIEARRVLNAFQVPDEQRWLVVGTAFESELLNDEKLNLAQNVGEAEAVSALREATIGRRFGFNIVVDQTIAPEAAYAYIRSAFIAATTVPAVPTGVSFGAITSYEGIALRHVVDYDNDFQQDRSVVNLYPGFRTVEDVLVARDAVTNQEYVLADEYFVRGVKLTLAGAPTYPVEGTDLANATGIHNGQAWTPTGYVDLTP
jgi:hypothetical protein